jgi:hypothetical protein
VWYVLWSMHGSQRELRHALSEISPWAVEPICGKLSRSLGQLADSSGLTAVKARLDAYAAQAAAQRAAQVAAADAATTAAAAASAARPTQRSAHSATAIVECRGTTPQHDHSREKREKQAAPDRTVKRVLRHADILQAEVRISRPRAEMPAVRTSAAAYVASTAPSLLRTAPNSCEPSTSDSSHLWTPALQNDTSRHPKDPQRCSEMAVSTRDERQEDDFAADVPNWVPHCKPPTLAAAQTSTAATGKENAWPSLPQKRTAGAAECAAVQRRALEVSAAIGGQSEPAVQTWRKPAMSGLDSTKMSDAYINLDCLD